MGYLWDGTRRPRKEFISSILFSFPSFLRSFSRFFFLTFSLRSILFLFLLISVLCFAVLLLDEFGFFSCLCFLAKKFRQKLGNQIKGFYHSANLLFIVIMTSISRKCCIVILSVFILRIYVCAINIENHIFY